MRLQTECAEHGPLVTAAFTDKSKANVESGDKELFRRNLGLVMVPGDHIVSLSINKEDDKTKGMFM